MCKMIKVVVGAMFIAGTLTAEVAISERSTIDRVLAGELEIDTEQARKAIDEYLIYLKEGEPTALDYNKLYKAVCAQPFYISKREWPYYAAILGDILERHAKFATKENEKQRADIYQMLEYYNGVMADPAVTEADEIQRQYEESALRFVDSLLMQSNPNFSIIEGRSLANSILMMKFKHKEMGATILRAHIMVVTPVESSVGELSNLLDAVNTGCKEPMNDVLYVHLVAKCGSMMRGYEEVGKIDSDKYKAIKAFVGEAKAKGLVL